jgi:hypothetical protein
MHRLRAQFELAHGSERSCVVVPPARCDERLDRLEADVVWQSEGVAAIEAELET